MKPKSLKKYKKALIWIFSAVGIISVLLGGIIYTSVKISSSQFNKQISNPIEVPKRNNTLIGFQTLARFKIENLDFELQKNIYSQNENALVNKAAVVQDNSIINHDGEPTGQNERQVPAPVKILAKEQTGHTSDFISGYTDNNSYYQSPFYYNDRVFMPILDSHSIYLKNERTSKEIGLDSYEGWDKIGYSTINSRVSFVQYRATDQLIAKFNPSNKQIFAMMINLYQADPAVINNTLRNYLPDFVILSNADNQIIKRLVFPSSVKKLTIKSNLLDRFDFSLANSNIQELELYTPNLTEYNPLALNPDTHLIFDTAYSKPFTSINLYGAKLTTQETQEAFNDIFVRRYYERYLQGAFVGGYISLLDLSNTGINSVNDYVVKNINPAYSSYTLSVTYNPGDPGQISILRTTTSIPSETQPTNPSNNTPSQPTDPNITTQIDAKEKDLKLVVSSTIQVDTQVVINVVGKYLLNNPRVNNVDISRIQLKSGTLVDIANNFKTKMSYLNVSV